MEDGQRRKDVGHVRRGAARNSTRAVGRRLFNASTRAFDALDAGSTKPPFVRKSKFRDRAVSGRIDAVSTTFPRDALRRDRYFGRAHLSG